MNFNHCDTDEEYLTLHDCVAERAYFTNGKLGFEFDDGFWISPDHPESNLSNLVRTDNTRWKMVRTTTLPYMFSRKTFSKKQSVLNGRFKN